MIDGALIDSKSTDFDMAHHQLIKKIHGNNFATEWRSVAANRHRSGSRVTTLEALKHLPCSCDASTSNHQWITCVVQALLATRLRCQSRGG